MAMTALRQKMIEDMQLHGFAERTQEAYLSAVRQLAKHYHILYSCAIISMRQLLQSQAVDVSYKRSFSVLVSRNGKLYDESVHDGCRISNTGIEFWR
jgi:hypothetical protein